MGRPRKRPEDETRTIQLTVRFPIEVHTAATAKAKSDRRSLNDWVIVALEERLGLRPATEPAEPAAPHGKARR